MIREYEIKYVKLGNGERLAYREVGSGENIILLIHGNMSSGVHYSPFMEILPENYKAYIIDLRGFGESSYYTRIEGLKDFSEDIRDFVSRLGLESFYMVGWSTGGGICMQFAADYPELVKKLVLIETVSYLGYPIYRKSQAGQALTGEVYSSREEMASDPVQVAPALAAMENKDFGYMNMLWDLAIYTSNKPLAEDNEVYINESLKQRNLVDVDWALASFNMSDRHNGYTQGTGLIHKLQLPVLCFWGNKDLVVLESMVRETAEAIGDNAEMVVLENSGHSPLVDCPELLADKIFEFIGR
ncbi:MAG: alpha/beta fold hydrolase [Bacillota bacterium]